MRAHGLIFPAARRRFGGALSRGRHSQASSGRECACLLPLPPSTHTHTRFANCPRVCQLQGMVSVEGQAQRTAMAAAIAGEYGGLCSFKNQMTLSSLCICEKLQGLSVCSGVWCGLCSGSGRA